MKCRVFMCLLGGMLAVLAGCAQPNRLDSPVPLERAQAAVAAAEAGDADAVYALVEMLDDADGGVRMVAILALKRLTGHTYGYTYHAPLAQRSAAVERWRTAVQEGRVQIVAGQQHTASPVSEAP